MTPAHAAVETEITISEAVTFPDGIPGFEACRHWVVMAAEAATPLRRLHAIDGTEASFLAIDPRGVLEGYRCELSAADRLRLGATEDEPLLWLALDYVSPFMMRVSRRHPSLKKTRAAFVSALREPADLLACDRRLAIAGFRDVSLSAGFAEAFFGYGHRLLTGGRAIHGCVLYRFAP